MTDPRLVRPKWRGRENVDALTIACIERAEQLVRERRPKLAHNFVVTKGSYQPSGGGTTSATTHDRGGAVDLVWCGHWVCYVALREAGMFIWHRTPDQGPWDDHFHGAPIGHPDMDPALARQEAAYFLRRDGLKNNGPDTGPQLSPIPRPIWPWPPEDDMAQYDELLQQIAADTKAARVAAEKAAVQAERARAGSYKRDRQLIALARESAADVDAILAKVDEG